MKFIKPSVCLIIFAAMISLFPMAGFPETDDSQMGIVHSVDPVKKEVLVKKDNVQQELMSGTKLCVRFSGKTVVLEIVKPMFVLVKCRTANSADFTSVEKNMKVYLYSSDAEDKNPELTDTGVGENEKTFLAAAQKGDIQKVKLLIKSGININATTGEFAPDLFTGYNPRESSDFTALHLAAVWNRPEIVEFLLNSGADYTTGHYTPYSYALSCNNLDCARIFIRHNADTGASGMTPLVKAVIIDDMDAVKKFLAEGADVNKKSYVDRTALMFASTGEMARLLITAGADPNLTDMFKSSALWNMANSGYIGPIEVILAEFHGKGLDIDNHGSYGDTLLMRAAMMGYIEVVKLLLSKGAQINAVNEYGTTALILASAEGHVDIVTFLLRNGAEINAVNKNGDTALIQAAYNGQKNAVRILLDAGADTGITASDGKSALDLAEEKGYKEIADMIRKK